MSESNRQRHEPSLVRALEIFPNHPIPVKYQCNLTVNCISKDSNCSITSEGSPTLNSLIKFVTQAEIIRVFDSSDI